MFHNFSFRRVSFVSVFRFGCHSLALMSQWNNACQLWPPFDFTAPQSSPSGPLPSEHPSSLAVIVLTLPYGSRLKIILVSHCSGFSFLCVYNVCAHVSMYEYRYIQDNQRTALSVGASFPTGFETFSCGLLQYILGMQASHPSSFSLRSPDLQ